MVIRTGRLRRSGKLFWAAASQRKAAASMAAEALGGQREGWAPRLGLVWGAMGERKPFVKQVSSTLESLPPFPGVAVTPVAFLAMPADTLCCGPRCFGNLQAQPPARHKLLQVGSSPWWSRTDQDLGNVGIVAEPL